ncbi:inhibitor of apoptosis-promoting Bax1-domain-containing protein [Chytriomyces cf. hyalinus JEL632]|nr:inhibitor of apoptosis-promoting Bax1-domain-containing protein [Chytriomyces cf. hyalinus JEL632]
MWVRSASRTLLVARPLTARIAPTSIPAQTRAFSLWRASRDPNASESLFPSTSTTPSLSMSDPPGQGAASTTGNTWARAKQSFDLAMGLAVIVGGSFAIDRVFNAQTELLDGETEWDDADLYHVDEAEKPPSHLVQSNHFVRNYLNETYVFVAIGVFLTGASAYALHLNPRFQRLMTISPVAVTISAIMASGVISNATLFTPSDYSYAKYLLFGAFAVTKGTFLSSALVISPALLGRAGLYTAGLIGSLATVAATTKSDNYIHIGGPLMGTLTVATLAMNVKNILPSTMHSMPKLYSLYLYGGLLVFGYFVIRDMQKVVSNGKLVEQGKKKRDVVNEALRLYLDFMSILP